MPGGKRFVGRLVAAIVGCTLLLPVAPAGAAVTRLEAALSGGEAEVPDPGDPDGSGGAQVKINVKKQKLCFTLVVVDITLPTAAAHIHDGEAGVAGPIVVTLKAPQEIAGTGIGLATGCVKNQPKPLLRDIRKNPDQF
ncbi:MAG TPA: CHRD domain-containing protein, partial [Actinomycetota bacterium]